MNKEYRVKSTTEIESILKNKKFSSNKYFTLYTKVNPETSHFRYAISVGKKLGNAVTRNLYKRKVRAIISSLDIKINNNIDVFIIVRTEVLNASYETLYNELKTLFIKQKLLQGVKNEKISLQKQA